MRITTPRVVLARLGLALLASVSSRKTDARHLAREAALQRCVADPTTTPSPTVRVEGFILHDALVISCDHLHNLLARRRELVLVLESAEEFQALGLGWRV